LKKFSFIAHMPDTPGSLHRAAKIIMQYDGNINRIQFDRRIDPGTVFYEVTATDEAYAAITRDLAAIGYLQTSLKPLDFLKITVDMPHKPGALHELLNYITGAGANITFIDFDDKGRHPHRLTISLNAGDSVAVKTLLDQLKSRYRLEILEYDRTGKHLDDTVFYIRFAQSVRELIGDSGDEFLLSFLADTNHVAQALMDKGCDPHQVFGSVLQTGRSMAATTGSRFYADVQQFPVTGTVTLSCFQPPCGGSLYLLHTEDEILMIDTGYGIYHDDMMAMLARYGLGDLRKLNRIVVTHADADHAGASGFFSVPVLMHEGTQRIIETNDRSYGQQNELSALNAFYTRMVNLFSHYRTPKEIRPFGQPDGTKRGIFPVIGTITFAGITLEVLDGLGGHCHGQVFLHSREHGLLFTADSVINFASMTKERAEYSSLAAFLIGSVNVDSDHAKEERTALLALAAETDAAIKESGRQCLICCGHGAVSVLKDGKLAAAGEIRKYEAGRQDAAGV